MLEHINENHMYSTDINLPIECVINKCDDVDYIEQYNSLFWYDDEKDREFLDYEMNCLKNLIQSEQI